MAQAERVYESFDMRKGTLRGASEVPDDDLRGCDPFYLAANKKLGSDQIASLIEALSLLGEFDACI
jgi:hypothetical protein